MRIENTQFGTIEVGEDKIIKLTSDILGFPGRRRFILLDRIKTRPFYWFQSVDAPGLAFVILNPYMFKPDYKVDLQPVLREMAWDGDTTNDLELYVLVNTTDGRPENMTANLIAPLVINLKRQEAVQLIIQNSPYSHQHRMYDPEESPTQAVG
ncbi:MAG: flagellar assembly protein FliW [Desulfobacterales bacterium]|nr:flagellar assembly protein FliW [Desulfobacterales bacterium]